MLLPTFIRSFAGLPFHGSNPDCRTFYDASVNYCLLYLSVILAMLGDGVLATARNIGFSVPRSGMRHDNKENIIFIPRLLPTTVFQPSASNSARS